MDKLYVIVRADIPAGAQVAQSCHAVAQFALFFRTSFTVWASGASNIVCLQVPDEKTLEKLMVSAAGKLIRFTQFSEPDFGGQMTALALEGSQEASRLVSSLPLTLKQRAA